MFVSILGLAICSVQQEMVHKLVLKLLIILHSSVKIRSLILNSLEINFVIGRLDTAML